MAKRRNAAPAECTRVEGTPLEIGVRYVIVERPKMKLVK